MIEVPLYRNTAILNVPLTNDKSRSVFTTITQKAEEVVGGGPVADPGEAPPLFLDQLITEGPKFFFGDWSPPSLSQGRDDRPLALSEGLDPPLRPQRKWTVSAWWLVDEEG